MVMVQVEAITIEDDGPDGQRRKYMSDDWSEGGCIDSCPTAAFRFLFRFCF